MRTRKRRSCWAELKLSWRQSLHETTRHSGEAVGGPPGGLVSETVGGPLLGGLISETVGGPLLGGLISETVGGGCFL